MHAFAQNLSNLNPRLNQTKTSAHTHIYYVCVVSAQYHASQNMLNLIALPCFISHFNLSPIYNIIFIYTCPMKLIYVYKSAPLMLPYLISKELTCEIKSPASGSNRPNP